jgi:hypothetical protein
VPEIQKQKRTDTAMLWIRALIEALIRAALIRAAMIQAMKCSWGLPLRGFAPLRSQRIQSCASPQIGHSRGTPCR